MHIHHLNCGTMFGGSVVSHCLLVEHDAGLVLVDTGFGRLDLARPDRRLGLSHRALMCRLDEGETAIRQIVDLGFQPTDVRDIVMTHLDYDHAGGLADFPWARVHVHEKELRAATRPGTFDQVRYRRPQFDHHPQWQVLPEGTERWFGLRGAAEIPDLPGILAIPLPGHTVGHIGVAVATDDRWLLHAGDAFYSGLQLHPLPMAFGFGGTGLGTPNPRLITQRIANARRLSALSRKHRDEVDVFCTHDRLAFDRLVEQHHDNSRSPNPQPEDSQ